MTREEALNAITAFVENYACGSDLDGLREAIEALKERPHGEWVEEKPKTAEERAFYGRAIYRCSNCKKISDVRYHAPFCECCGASMVANDEQVTGKLNSEIIKSKSEIIKSKSEIVPDYRDGWRLRGEAE